jgi:hypothetical protein
MPIAWHMIWHCALIFAVQDPVQHAWHFAMHVALGGATLHCALQFAEQLALHEPLHCETFPLDEHCPSQSALHCALHCALQSNMPGFALHEPVHVPEQFVVHDTSAETLQLPLQPTSSFASHAMSTLIGVHCAVHPPDVSTLQFAFAEMSMLPHASSGAA